MLLLLLQNTATIVCGGFSRILTKNKHFWESGLETIEDSLQHWLNCEIGPVDGKEENGCCCCRLWHGCMIALALLLIPLIFQSLNTSQQKQHTHIQEQQLQDTGTIFLGFVGVSSNSKGVRTPPLPLAPTRPCFCCDYKKSHAFNVFTNDSGDFCVAVSLLLALIVCNFV